MAYQLTQDDLLDRLREQVGFLERSAVSFDSGYDDEAKRLAVIIRVLLHDTGASSSLLGLLGVKDALQFVDTADPINPANLMPTVGLAVVQFTIQQEGGEGKYVAPLGDIPPNRIRPPRPFQLWWEEPVTKDGSGTMFSRKDYVLNVANKEGGAHVDPSLEQPWAQLTRDNSLGWTTTSASGPYVPLDSPALASIRQIAYEVDQTIRGQLSHFLTP